MLISNQVMHYRVSVYKGNYFHRRFRDSGFEFSVIADRLQEQNQRPLEFEFQEVAFDFLKYRKAIIDTKPAAVILFLHMKDVITWPLFHWLEIAEEVPSPSGRRAEAGTLKREAGYRMFNYAHGMADALILYSEACRDFLRPNLRSRVFVANNTINYDDFPTIEECKERDSRKSVEFHSRRS